MEKLRLVNEINVLKIKERERESPIRISWGY